jgi:cytochrome c
MRLAFRVNTILCLFLLVCCTQKIPSSQNRPQGTEAPNVPVSKSAETKSGERGTPEEAKAMLQKAVDHYNDVGRKQALADFNAKKAPFGDRDLYVACIGPDHLIVANGGFPSLVGTSADAWKDADGRSLGKAAWDALSSKREGSVAYQWYNPVTRKLEPKVLFVQKAGDDVCGVGAYNPQ